MWLFGEQLGAFAENNLGDYFMELFKSIHKYMCEPLAINSYELFVTTIIVLLIHDLWFN